MLDKPRKRYAPRRKVKDLTAEIGELKRKLIRATITEDRLLVALHDAIKLPKGKVPESAKPFYTPATPDNRRALTAVQVELLAKLVTLGVLMIPVTNRVMRSLAHKGYVAREDGKWKPTKAGIDQIAPYLVDSAIAQKDEEQ